MVDPPSKQFSSIALFLYEVSPHHLALVSHVAIPHVVAFYQYWPSSMLSGTGHSQVSLIQHCTECQFWYDEIVNKTGWSTRLYSRWAVSIQKMCYGNKKYTLSYDFKRACSSLQLICFLIPQGQSLFRNMAHSVTKSIGYYNIFKPSLYSIWVVNIQYWFLGECRVCLCHLWCFLNQKNDVCRNSIFFHFLPFHEILHFYLASADYYLSPVFCCFFLIFSSCMCFCWDPF